jgi:hypothetical protein
MNEDKGRKEGRKEGTTPCLLLQFHLMPHFLVEIFLPVLLSN